MNYNFSDVQKRRWIMSAHWLHCPPPSRLLILSRNLTVSVLLFCRRTTTAWGRCPTRWPMFSSSASPWSTLPVSRTCERNGCPSCRSTHPVSLTCSLAPRLVPDTVNSTGLGLGYTNTIWYNCSWAYSCHFSHIDAPKFYIQIVWDNVALFWLFSELFLLSKLSHTFTSRQRQTEQFVRFMDKCAKSMFPNPERISQNI